MFRRSDWLEWGRPGMTPLMLATYQAAIVAAREPGPRLSGHPRRKPPEKPVA